MLPLNPIPFSGVTGVTYDSSDDTFWLAFPAISSVVTVVHITRAADVLSVFPAGTGSGTVSLAYDRADDAVVGVCFDAKRIGTSPILGERCQGRNSLSPRCPALALSPASNLRCNAAPSAVPEPASWALLCSGLLMLAALRQLARTRSRGGAPRRVFSGSASPDAKWPVP